MKHLIVMTAIAAALVLTACKKQEATSETVTANETATQATEVVEGAAAAVTETAEAVKAE